MKKILGWEKGHSGFIGLGCRTILRDATFQDVVMSVGGPNGVKIKAICI